MAEVLKIIVQVLHHNVWEPGQWNALLRSCKTINRACVQKCTQALSFRKNLGADFILKCYARKGPNGGNSHSLAIYRQEDRQLMINWKNGHLDTLNTHLSVRGPTSKRFLKPYILMALEN